MIHTKLKYTKNTSHDRTEHSSYTVHTKSQQKINISCSFFVLEGDHYVHPQHFLISVKSETCNCTSDRSFVTSSTYIKSFIISNYKSYRYLIIIIWSWYIDHYIDWSAIHQIFFNALNSEVGKAGRLISLNN